MSRFFHLAAVCLATSLTGCAREETLLARSAKDNSISVDATCTATPPSATIALTALDEEDNDQKKPAWHVKVKKKQTGASTVTFVDVRNAFRSFDLSFASGAPLTAANPSDPIKLVWNIVASPAMTPIKYTIHADCNGIMLHVDPEMIIAN